MKVINDSLLAELRARQRCEWCGRPGLVHAHHIHSKGMGGWGQLDVAINIVCLCPAHHAAHHDGNEPTFRELLDIAATREGVSPADITLEIYRLKRLPNNADPGPILGEKAIGPVGGGPALHQRPAERPDGPVHGDTVVSRPGHWDTGVPPDEAGWVEL